MADPAGGGRVHKTDERRLREDRELFERYLDERDPVDRELLVERFLPLARSLAGRYLRHGEAFDDIFQVACLGLVKAIDGFDVTRGRAFSSYAAPTIVGEIKRYYRDRTWTVHVPRDLPELTLAADRRAAPRGRRGGRHRRRRDRRERGRLRAGRSARDAALADDRPVAPRSAGDAAALRARPDPAADRRARRHQPDAGLANPAPLPRQAARLRPHARRGAHRDRAGWNPTLTLASGPAAPT